MAKSYTKTDQIFRKARGIDDPGRRVHSTDPTAKVGTAREGFIHPNSLLGRADRAKAASSVTAADRIMNKGGGRTTSRTEDIDLDRPSPRELRRRAASRAPRGRR